MKNVWKLKLKCYTSVFLLFMFSSVKYTILLYLECHQGSNMIDFDKDVVISRFSLETWEHANLVPPTTMLIPLE